MSPFQSMRIKLTFCSASINRCSAGGRPSLNHGSLTRPRIEFATATRLLVSAEPLTAEKPIGTLGGRAALNRIGGNVGQQLAIHVADARGRAGLETPISH